MGRKSHQVPLMRPQQQERPKSVSLLDVMIDGREFESLLTYDYVNLNIRQEIVRVLQEIEAVRQRPVICYIANTVTPNLKADNSINSEDELPINELIASVSSTNKSVDMIIVTPGGTAQQVDRIVNSLRSKFDNVSFILPAGAMSAGTILIMSGDEIIMNSTSYFGPIDPQVVTKNGNYVAAQSLLELINLIQSRGEALLSKGQNPLWTDIQILNNMDPRDIGSALAGSNYSIELVERYLHDYKFKSWVSHSDRRAVKPDERKKRAHDIADILCDHKQWKAHGHGITRDVADSILKLKITKTESVAGLDKAVKRFWALFYWVFQSTTIYKLYASTNYFVAKSVNINKEA